MGACNIPGRRNPSRPGPGQMPPQYPQNEHPLINHGSGIVNPRYGMPSSMSDVPDNDGSCVSIPSTDDIPVQVGNSPAQPKAFRKQSQQTAKVHELKTATDFGDLPSYVYDMMDKTSHAECNITVGKNVAFSNFSRDRMTMCHVNIALADALDDGAPAMTVAFTRSGTKDRMQLSVTAEFSLDDFETHTNARKLYNKLVDEINLC